MTEKNKTLSQQICELCGIEPKQAEKRCKECNLTMKECECWDCYKDIYPNFENPENFVKLWELPISSHGKSALALFVNSRARFVDKIAPHNIKSFLQELIVIFKDGDGIRRIQEIKQAIREYDGWVWG